MAIALQRLVSNNGLARTLVGLVRPIAILALMLSAQRGVTQLANPDQIGLLPYGTYSGGIFDQVNLTNGNLTVKIPLMSYPQKGSLSLSLSVTLNSSPINVSKNCEVNAPATEDTLGKIDANCQ